ncbi:NAD-dependent epimerase/dehydratase family protein [Methanobacterium sp. CWC-01]|uniref:GDP-mannose 4,6-dehydratase n=1 Tax=Methanobacterium aridiramus TaxID=2584467 RepID=UPI002574E6D9|nr:GDP-mannose 4,6-dehydratase [Methanobacterium sp. CWC-01]WJI08909.1 NAD-dependent epimerase/dehydratase family protein [Methanobacterium sp. CWC-01]
MSFEFWNDRNVFVTGCTGLLGSWLTKKLVESGANVIGLIRDLVPKSNLNWSGFDDKIVTVRGEIEDYFILERVLNEYEIDTVFHLAAQTIVTIANRNPISTFNANIKGTWNLLEAARRSPLLERMVVASSDKAYGSQLNLPYDEKTPLEGKHPYDVSKSCADLLCGSYHETYGLPVCVTRCGNFYGGGDLNFNRIVPGTIRSVLENNRPIIRSDGKMVRDYFYIEDGAEAYMLLAEKMTKKIHGEAFNFSNEDPMNVLEIVNEILKAMSSDLKPIIRNESSNEIEKQYLSALKAREILGWNSRYSMEEGLEKTIKWYQDLSLNSNQLKK